MKRLKLSMLLILAFLSLFLIKGICALFVHITSPAVNNFSLTNSYTYTVLHKKMDLNGTTYTTASQVTGYAASGSTVTPEVLTFQGFTSPQPQTVTISSNNQTITYLYTRNQYLLTINDSQYVTTTTPTGYYYYESEIHLVADADNGSGNEFVKWSNNVTTRDYTFLLTQDTTIGPEYSTSYNITFVHNNGTANSSTTVVENHSIGSFPNLTYEDCQSGLTGSYHDRQCNYAYRLVGWYKESTFVNQVNEDYVPTGDETLYAKWTKVYYGNAGPVVFDGTNYIDTGIKLFSAENADKDFIATFTVDVNNGYSNANGGDNRGTIFTDMYEVANPYPGVNFYNTGTGNKYTMNVNVLGNKVKDANTGYVTGQSVVIKKINGVVSYSYNNGAFVTINNLSSFVDYFDNNATFGASTKANGTIYRFFKGTLSDMSLEVIEPESYTIHYDANGGTGMMIDQTVRLTETINLTSNAFTYDGAFVEWNTAPDGSGTSYSDGQQVSGLGNDGDVITLYAQWIDYIHFYVHFDANGGTGSMNDQQFTYGDPPTALTKNTYEKANYEFVSWNTAPDGTGTKYTDEELVRNLSIIDDDVITLYAQYLKVVYKHANTATFDGTTNTFINTGVNLYSQTTYEKDFVIRFTVTSVASNVLDSSQPTIINCKDESNSKWPGFNIRFNNDSSTRMIPVYKWNNSAGSTSGSSISTSNLPVEFTFKRTDKVVTLRYTYSGYDSGEITLYDQRNWTLNQFFVDNVSFGGIYNSNHNPDRFFRGTLSDITILLDE